MDLIHEMSQMAKDTEWLGLFELVASQAEARPRFTLAILQAIDADIDIKERNLHIDSSDDFDAIAKRPYAGLPAPIMIVVNWGRAPAPIANEIFSACSRLNCKGLLVIMPLVVTPTSHFSTPQQVPVRIKFVFYEEAFELIKRHVSIVTRHVPQLTALAVKERLKDVEERSKTIQLKNDGYWKQTRLKLLEDLKKSYQDNNLTLFLGAGVSTAAGLPPWKRLIDQLMIRVVEEQRLYPNGHLSTDKVQSAARILSAFRGDNPLISARYIRNALTPPRATPEEANERFVSTLKDVLYEAYNENQPCGLVTEIAEVCRGGRGRTGARAIVTYNFDDLIERELSRLGLPFRTIWSEKMPQRDGQQQDEVIDIYHVHGLLPRDSAKESAKESAMRTVDLTFSEERYHHLYVEPYSWSNLQQLFLLRDSTCLLIGFSMTDPSLRRLLEISAGKERAARHFAFLKRTLFKEAMGSTEKIPELSREEINMVLTAHHEIQELAFDELGVKIIWVDEFPEIEELLKEIRSYRAASPLNN